MKYLILITGLILLLACETLPTQQTKEEPANCIDDGESVQCESVMYCIGNYSRQPWNNDKECFDSTIASR